MNHRELVDGKTHFADDDTLRYVATIEQQRDELLAALEELQLRYTTLFNLYAPTHYHPSSNYTSDLDLALATSNAAIAKVKP